MRIQNLSGKSALAVASLALLVGGAGGAVAATTIAANSVGTSQVINGSLLVEDLKVPVQPTKLFVADFDKAVNGSTGTGSSQTSVPYTAGTPATVAKFELPTGQYVFTFKGEVSGPAYCRIAIADKIVDSVTTTAAGRIVLSGFGATKVSTASAAPSTAVVSCNGIKVEGSVRGGRSLTALVVDGAQSVPAKY